MNQDDLIVCAFRYCLGRSSYVVSDMVMYLRKHWKEICAPYQTLIKKEIIESIERGRYGMEMDKSCWEKLLLYVHDIGDHKLNENKLEE